MAACGRFGFDARIAPPDAPRDVAADSAPDAPPPVPMLVAMTGSSTMDPTTPPGNLQVTIPAVGSGHLLVVGLAEHNGTAVATIADGSGHALVPAGSQAVSGSTASEIWYSGSAAGATSFTITTTSPSNFDVWFAEFSHTSAVPAAVNGGCLQYPPTIVQITDATTVPNELVFNVMMAQYPMYVSGTLAPFVTLPPQTGNGAGYYIPAQPGSYTAQYGIAAGSGMTAMTCQNTAVWMPAL